MAPAADVVGGDGDAEVGRLEQALKASLVSRSSKMRAVFRSMDVNGDGVIGVSELSRALALLSLKATPEVRVRPPPA